MENLERSSSLLPAAALATAALAPNSRAAYRHALARLDASGGGPVDDARIAAHLTDLYNQGLAPASIAIVPAAVKYYATAAGLENPCGPQTGATMKIIRREGRGRGRGQVDGIRWDQVAAAAAVAGQGNDLAGLRDAAILETMSDALLRASELVALDVTDVEASADGSGVVNVRFSKTDQEGAGETLYLGPPAVERVSAWISAAGIDEGALFRWVRKGGRVTDRRLTIRSIGRIVKIRAKAVGLEFSRVSSHSLRVGSAQSLAAAGAGVVEMQVAGRWKSPQMPAKYGAGGLASRGAIARLKHGK